MNIALTQLSKEEYERLLSGRMTPAVAAEYLREERIVLRTFHDMLLEFYPGEDLQTRLIQAFVADEPEANPDSVSRRVRNWLSGQNHPTNREDIFHIAFALGLTEVQANVLLGISTDYGIHYRNGRDVVYAWFLRTGKSYGEARRFFETLPAISMSGELPGQGNARLTHSIQNEFLRIQNTEELRSCYQANLDNFGYLHMRAYMYFRRYMDLLIRPESKWSDAREENYSMEAVMRLYLSMHMPPGKSRSQYNLTQRLIRRGWPNTTSLKNIYNRKEDVSRKLLLLLYVVTENLLDEDDGMQFEEFDSIQARVEDHWWTLNAILTDCGMPVIDPRNSMDWLVLYSLTATDEPMSRRMEQVIELLFSESMEDLGS